MNNGQNHTNDLLSAYHDGELSAVEREAAERLLAESAEARAELEDYQRLSAELRTLPNDAAPIDVSKSVLAAIAQPAAEQTSAQPTRTKSRRRWRIAVPLGIVGAAAAAVLALVAWQFGDSGNLSVTVADRGAESDARGVSASPDMASEAMATDSGARAERSGPMTASELGNGVNAGGSAAPVPRMLAGDNARPPAGFNVGDIYSYIDRTDEGEIIVVQAYVVDVRRAVDQMQVLLARNSIPTTKVSRRANETLSFELPATAPRNDLALYVESDPERIKMAFQDLQGQLDLKSNAFQGLHVSGILETGHIAAGMGGMGVGGTSTNGLQFLPPQEARKPDVKLLREPAAPAGKPDENSTADEATLGRGLEEHLTETPGNMDPLRNRFSQPGQAADAVTHPAPATGKRAGTVPQFQTVINVSNGVILERLQRQRKLTFGKADASGNAYFLKRDSGEQGRAKQNKLDYNRATRPEGSANRTRLLLVIQEGPAPRAPSSEQPTDSEPRSRP